ncbi:MAG: hypothetical protein ACR2M4_02415 [Actinomycetota bacterium]
MTRSLYGSHEFDDPRRRWSFMRYYLIALSTAFGSGPPSESELLEAVVKEEKSYLAEMKRRADADEKARRPAVQLQLLRKWAKKQPMNPADDFEPGIAYYDLATAASKPDWMERDVSGISQEDYTVVLSYRTGSPLKFPAGSIDLTGKYYGSVAELFARRHKASGRLVPFAIYEADVDLYSELPEIDEVPQKERYLMALPRFDAEITPGVLSFYSDEATYLQVAQDLTNVMSLMTLRRTLPAGARFTAGAVGASAQVGTRGFAMTRAAAAEVMFAVRTYGFSTYAAAHMARAAYTYYLVNAVAVNTTVVLGTELVLSIAGSDMGPISPGDTITMAVQLDDAVRAGRKTWNAISAEVVELDPAAGKAVIRVTSVDPITDDVAKSTYDLGKKVKGDGKAATRAARNVDNTATDAKLAAKTPSANVKAAQALGKGKVKLTPDPRKVSPLNEIQDAMNKVSKGLDKLGHKYNAKAIAKIKNLSADAIRESGIRPSDLAKLANSLSRAGKTTQKFINDFHDVPGFERVLLTWAKRSYWNSKLKKPAWQATQSFYTGASYVMKYATAKLDPKFVRFEWPASINDTKWGDEVFARYVDIVITGGSRVKPGQHLQLELKSWTEFVLGQKAHSHPGGIGYQLIRDTALFRPENIRWVFDAKKVTKAKVIQAFEDVITKDPYLAKQWGGKDADPAEIRKLLDKVIEVF